MNFEAKKADASMAHDIAFILTLSWQRAYKGIIPDDYLQKLSAEKKAERIKKSIGETPEEFYLFSVDKLSAGAAILCKDREKSAKATDGEICAIYFLPEYWGLGYGKMAMHYSLKRFKELSCTDVTVWVLEENKRARNFYEKCGLSFSGTKQEINIGKPLIVAKYRGNIDACLLQCKHL